MRIRSTIILCLVAMAGVAAAIVVEHAGPRRDDRVAEGRRRLLAPGALPVDAVSRITLLRAGEERVVLERSGEEWRQTEPVAHPMDSYSIRQLIGDAAAAEAIDRVVPDTADESALGLAPPRAELRFEWPGGSLSMKLGRRGVGGRAYVQIRGDQHVYVVNQDLHERAVGADVKEWRDRTIFRGAGVDSDRVEISSGEDAIVLVRQRKRWMMEQPVRTRLNEAALDELFQALGRAQCGGFILDRPSDLSRFGLGAPAGKLNVTGTRRERRGEQVIEREETQRLLVGARMGVGAQDRFGMLEDRGVVIRLPEAVLRALFRQPRELVAATGSGVVPADVKSVRIDGPGGDVTLVRDLERWSSPDHADRPVRGEVVEALLETLTQVHAPEVELKEFPRELQVATITLYGYDARPLDTVRVTREPAHDGGPGRWALENGDNVLRIFSPSLEMALTPEQFGLPGEEAGAAGRPRG